MLNWYTELSKGEKRTFWGCFGGWALDALDVQMFSFLIGTLIAVFGISQTQAGILGTTTLVASAIGGWIAGGLADRYGRVKIMQVTVIWYAFFTFLSGFTTSYDQLLITRSLQGLGFGGEWACGAVLIGEIIRPQHRGKAVGCVQSGYAVGWGFAAIISGVLFMLLPPEWAWRAAFWVGILPAALVIFLRRYVHEPEVFTQAQRITAASAAADRPGMLTIFKPEYLRITILTSLLALGLQGSGYAIVTWLPTFMTTVRHLSPAVGSSYVLVVTIGALFGYIVSAYLSDAIGRRRNFIAFSICSLVIVLIYTYVPAGDTAMLLLGLPLGFFTIGIYSSLGPYFTELFPTAIRATGQSFAYNFGRSLGAFFVTFVGLLAQIMPLGQAIGLLALGGYLLTIVATLMLPETKGIELSSVGNRDEVPTALRSALT
jgi:MFS family permease